MGLYAICLDALTRGLKLNWYGTLRLTADFTRGHWKDGGEIGFTRGEAQVLATLVRNQGRAVGRGQILDGLSGEGSDKNDRVVDFMINRLRRKLGDNSRTPRFIQTRYGEGYVWLPRASDGLPAATGAHVVIGPLRGLQHLDDAEGLARAFVDSFQKHFSGNFSQDRKVVCDPDCPAASAFQHGIPEIGIEMTFVRHGDLLDYVVHAKAFKSGMTYHLRRYSLSTDKADLAKLPETSQHLSSRLSAEIWKSLTLTANEQAPLALAMHNAAQILQAGLPGWAESHKHLQGLVAQNPTDSTLKMMLAINIHSKYVQHGLELFGAGTDTCAQDEAQIEALVTESLPSVQQDPFLAASAAKMLYFLRRSYRPMARDLIESVFRSTVILPPALIILGMLRTFSGQIELGLTAFDQALETVEPGSENEVYILCLKCQALMAIDDRERLGPVLQRLYVLHPSLQFMYDLLYGPEDVPSPHAMMAIQQMTPMQARGLLIFADYLCGRLFESPKHRENTLRIPRKLLCAKFGPEIAVDLPGDM